MLLRGPPYFGAAHIKADPKTGSGGELLSEDQGFFNSDYLKPFVCKLILYLILAYVYPMIVFVINLLYYKQRMIHSPVSHTVAVVPIPSGNRDIKEPQGLCVRINVLISNLIR